MPRGKTKNNIIYPHGRGTQPRPLYKEPLSPCDATSFPCC